MTLVKIDSDEWYPVYSLEPEYGYEVELTDAEIAQVQAAFTAFDKAQDVLRMAWEKRNDSD